MRDAAEKDFEGGEEDRDGSLRRCSSQKKLLLFTGELDLISLPLKDNSVGEVTIADLGRLWANTSPRDSPFPLD